MTAEPVAPALSTYQDESTFEYDRYQDVAKPRTHLGLKENENYTERITEYYSVNDLVKFLAQTEGAVPKYRRVTLQFPDELICDSASIVHLLQQELKKIRESKNEMDVNSNENKEDNKSDDHKHDHTTKTGCSSSGSSCGCKSGCADDADSGTDSDQKVWILADTSYSACCIDEVAAEHVGSDLVVHFGDSCLNPVDKLAAVYVFGKPRVDIDAVVSKFIRTYPDPDLKVMLMADTPHTSALGDIFRALKQQYVNLAYADIGIDAASDILVIGTKYASTGPKYLNRRFQHLQGDDDIESTLSEYELFHITMPETPRLLQLTTTFLSVSVYEPSSASVSSGPYPNLMRRYRYMHMARSAGTVGLLVNTLSLANTKKVINSIAQRLKHAGKKHYVFVVGKPNVAKLANFENIDMWCILGCDHLGIIIDQNNEYFKPIVTPYELLLALSDEVTWTGKWVTDFNRVLSMVDEEEEEKSQDNEDGDESDEEPEFNPVTGTYVSTSRPLRQLRHLQILQADPEETSESETAIVKKLSSAVAIKNTVSTSAVHLQSRHWTGLGSDWDTTGDEGALVEEGDGGVARGYDYDHNNKANK